MKKLILLLGFPIITSCSNIKLSKDRLYISYPDEQGWVTLSGSATFRRYTPRIIHYEILNITTGEKISGSIGPYNHFSEKMRANEKDRIKFTFQDDKGAIRSKIMRVPIIPLYEKLIRQGYTPEQAKQIIYEQWMINAYKRAALGTAIQRAGQQFNYDMQRYQYQQQQQYQQMQLDQIQHDIRTIKLQQMYGY